MAALRPPGEGPRHRRGQFIINFFRIRMKTLLRRLRGIAVTAVLWAVGWGIVGAVLLPVANALDMLRRGLGWDSMADLLIMIAASGAVFGAYYGAWAGAAFGVFLTVAERRRGLAALSTKRMALWGALGGTALPTLHLAVVALTSGGPPPNGMGPFLAMSAVLGAGFAAGTLALARGGDGPGASPAAPAEALPSPNGFDEVPGSNATARERTTRG